MKYQDGRNDHTVGQKIEKSPRENQKKCNIKNS